MFEDLLAEEQLVLVFKDKIATWLLAIDGVEQESPQLFERQAGLFEFVVGVADVVEEELVFGWRRAES